MRTSELLGAKNFGFFEIYGVSARMGVEAVQKFSGERGQFFAILFGVFMDLALIKIYSEGISAYYTSFLTENR